MLEERNALAAEQARANAELPELVSGEPLRRAS